MEIARRRNERRAVGANTWLIVSPWALGTSHVPAKINFIVVGVLVLALAAHELWDAPSRGSDQEPNAPR